MTSVSLFDTLSRERSGSELTEAELASRRAALAAELVAAALADFERIREFEVAATPATEIPSEQVRETFHRLYAEWVEEAEQVWRRATALAAQGVNVPRLSELDRATGTTHARLKITPAQVTAALEQVRQGQFIPLKELRDELRARLRG